MQIKKITNQITNNRGESTMKIYYIKGNVCKDLTPSFKLTKEQEMKLIKFGITAILVYKTCGVQYLFAYDGISTAVKPLVDVLVDLAEPISYGFMCKGFLEMMSGHSENGKKTIKSAITGYLGIQFIPQIFKIIKAIKLS